MEDVLDEPMMSSADARVTDAVSRRLSTGQFQKQMTRIREAAEDAQKKIDYRTAHNEHILRAVEVVEAFLKRTHRLCYGGQAINAQLPRRYQFYDPEYSIPDYDFFTPSQATDIQEITEDLRKAGFTEISAREGMHEGTIKIYVEYIPVADLTLMNPTLYRTLAKREFRKDGISYLDANTLRMMMYLELSRPNGEVSRWPKIYERLLLFNEFVPRSTSEDAGHGARVLQPARMSTDETYLILRFIVTHQRVFAGGDLLSFFQAKLPVVQAHTKLPAVQAKLPAVKAHKKPKRSVDWILRSKKPIVFYSPEPEIDAEELRGLVMGMPSGEKSNGRKRKITIKSYKTQAGDMIPSVQVLMRAKKPLVFIIEETACHAYQTVPIHFEGKVSRTLRIASIDTLITLYFSLGLMKGTLMGSVGSMDSLANQLVEISIASRGSSAAASASPFISLTCSGHQTALSSLIRAKVARVLRKKTVRVPNVSTRSTQKRRRFSSI